MRQDRGQGSPVDAIHKGQSPGAQSGQRRKKKGLEGQSEDIQVITGLLFYAGYLM